MPEPGDAASLHTHLVPRDKHDLAAVARATSVGWPGIEPVAAELLEWIQDMNWPVAPPLAELVGGVGRPLAPYVREALTGTDSIWKYWLITTVVDVEDLELARALEPELRRLATGPSADERAEEVDVAAVDVLTRLGVDTADGRPRDPESPTDA